MSPPSGTDTGTLDRDDRSVVDHPTQKSASTRTAKEPSGAATLARSGETAGSTNTDETRSGFHRHPAGWVPIRWKLVLAIGIPFLLAYLALIWIHYRRAREDAIASTRSRLAQVSARHAAELDGTFAAVVRVAQTVGDLVQRERPSHPDSVEQLLRATLERNPVILGCGLAFPSPSPTGPPGPEAALSLYMRRTADGSTHQVNLVEADPILANRDWFLIPKLLGRPSWTEPYYDTFAGETLISTYSVPFFDNGVFAGLFRVDVALEGLAEPMRRMTVESGFSMIVGQHGRLVYHPDVNLMLRWTIFALAEWHDKPEWEEVGRAMIGGATGTKRVKGLGSEQEHWVVFAPITSSGWSFAVVVPEDEILAPVYAGLRHDSLILAAGVPILLLTLLITSFWITAPIGRLAEAARDLASGNLDARADAVDSRDEIGDFARTFNNMVVRLREHVSELTHAAARREAVEQELRIARQIQLSLLPSDHPPFPDRTDFSLEAFNRSAKEVAGDFYDYFLLSDDLLVVLIGDVSGKGVPAALFMAITRTLIRTLEGADRDPNEVLRMVNNRLEENNDQSLFVTLFLAHYQPSTGRMRYSNAGHPPPYIVTPDGSLRTLETKHAPILGVFRLEHVEEAETTLQPGESLVLCTDGVTDAHRFAGQHFGEERLEAILSSEAESDPGGIIRAVVDQVDAHQGDTVFDDVTLLVLRRELD